MRSTRAAEAVAELGSLGRFTHMAKVTSLRGPVENLDGKLMLRIPLAAGGSELVACSRGIGVVDGEFLSIHIMDWLAAKLSIGEGSIVSVDNADGKFNIRTVDADTTA